MINRASWFLSIGVYAHAIGISNFGYFSLYLSIWIIISKLTSFGTEIWITRYVAKRSHNQKLKLPTEGIIISLISYSILGTLIYTYIILGKYYSIELTILLGLVGLRQLLENIREHLVGVLQGLQRMDYQTKSTAPIEVIQFLTIALLYYYFNKIGVIGLFLPFLIASLLKVITLNYYIKNLREWRSIIRDKSPIKLNVLLLSCIPIGIMGIIYNIAIQTQTLLLKHFSSSEIVGAYSAALIVISAGDILLGIYRQALFPILVKQYHQDILLFNQFMFRKIKYYMMTSFLLGLAISVLSGCLIKLSLINEYKLSLNILMYTAPIIIPALAMNSFMGSIINATSLNIYAARSLALIFLILTPTSIYLVYYFDWAGVMSYILIFSLSLSFSYFNILNNASKKIDLK